MGSFLTAKISSQPLTEFWWNMLSGCQVCNWGIQHHLCSTYRVTWGLVVVQRLWLSGRPLAAQSQGCLGFDPATAGLFTFLYFHLITSKFLARIHWNFLNVIYSLTTVLKLLVAISIMPYGNSYSLNLGVCPSLFFVIIFILGYSVLSKLFLGVLYPLIRLMYPIVHSLYIIV